MGMLLAYDTDGNVIATLDYRVLYDEDGRAAGLDNFDEREALGEEMTDVWLVDSEPTPIKGSKVWPEWLGSRAGEFRVELEGSPGRKRIAALVHKDSGVRRERASVDSAIAARIAAAGPGGVADIRDIVGGPGASLELDERGEVVPRTRKAAQKTGSRGFVGDNR